MRRRHVMEGFGEAPLFFLPTYKYDSGESQSLLPHGLFANSGQSGLSTAYLCLRSGSRRGFGPYDSSTKRRVPSWTDRILVRPPNAHMHVIGYMAIDTACISDHKPVVAHISCRLRVQPTPQSDSAEALSQSWRCASFPWIPHDVADIRHSTIITRERLIQSMQRLKTAACAVMDIGDTE